MFKDKIESKIAQFTEKAMKNNDNIKTNAIKAIATDLTVVNTPKQTPIKIEIEISKRKHKRNKNLLIILVFLFSVFLFFRKTI